jgi:hypothetical protein
MPAASGQSLTFGTRPLRLGVDPKRNFARLPLRAIVKVMGAGEALEQ